MAQAPPSAGAHAPAPVRAAPVRASPPAGASGAIQCAQVVRPPVVAMAASVGSPSAIQEAAGVGSEPSVLMARRELAVSYIDMLSAVKRPGHVEPGGGFVG